MKERVAELIDQIGNSLDSPEYAAKVLTECGKEILNIVDEAERYRVLPYGEAAEFAMGFTQDARNLQQEVIDAIAPVIQKWTAAGAPPEFIAYVVNSEVTTRILTERLKLMVEKRREKEEE